jgi:hypothetical protein
VSSQGSGARPGVGASLKPSYALVAQASRLCWSRVLTAHHMRRALPPRIMIENENGTIIINIQQALSTLKMVPALEKAFLKNFKNHKL